MKTLVISIESAVILSGMNFWQYRDWMDKMLVIIVSTVIFFVVIDQLEDRYRERKRKQRQARMLQRDIERLTKKQNRPS